MSRIFFISDLHLDHKNIIRYCKRPFRTVEGMNRAIINNWNRTVGKRDIVYFLGDMSFGRGSRPARYWLRKLNGKIIFIKGSHDKFGRHSRLFRCFDGKKFVLVHDPRDVPDDWDGWVIHGHVHQKRPFIDTRRRTINVSAEVLNYRPISLEELMTKVGIEDPKPEIETIKKVQRRDGTIVDFDKGKITNTIFKAVRNRRKAEELSNEVVRILEQRYAGRISTLKDIHKVVEGVLADHRIQQRAPRLGRPPRWVRYNKRFGIFETHIKGLRVEWDERLNAWIDPDEHGPPGAEFRLTLWKDRKFLGWYRKWKFRKRNGRSRRM